MTGYIYIVTVKLLMYIPGDSGALYILPHMNSWMITHTTHIDRHLLALSLTHTSIPATRINQHFYILPNTIIVLVQAINGY